MKKEPINTPRRFRLPRKAILRGRESFRLLFEKGKNIRSATILMKYRLLPVRENTPGVPSVRTAFVVGRKHGRAVDRNRVRRLMREAWRRRLPEIEEKIARSDDPVSIELALIWTGPPARTSRPDYRSVSRDIEKTVRRLEREIGADSPEETS